MSKPLAFYQLERPPFEDGVRDAAAVGTRPLRAALERTRRFIETETAVVCVKGRPGIGKTYFGLALPGVLPPGTLIARIGQPAQPWSALHAAIAKSFELDPQSFSADALHELRNQDRRLVIEVDPVEQLQLDAFTPLLSLLSHAYLPERRLVQAVLIGDLARLPVATREGLAALGSATLELEALPDGDLPSYVQKRLDRAGYRGQPLFSRAACEEIRRRADGVPREVNRICALALELAATRRAQSIEPDLVRDACAAAPPAPIPPSAAPVPEPAAPAAASPRAVIGRLQLQTRSVPQPAPAAPVMITPPGQAPSGQRRRIEPLPPEPVVEAEPETPLMDAVFVDDDVPMSAEASPVAGPPAAAAAPPPVPPPPAVAVAAARPPVEAAPGPVPSAAPEPAPLPRRARAFPWIHVVASLAASWALAAGLFWLYERREPEPVAPAPIPAIGLRPEPASAAAEASLQAAPEATPVQVASTAASTPEAEPPAPTSSPTSAPALPASPDPRPDPEPSVPAPTVTALVQPPAPAPAATPVAPAPTRMPRKAPTPPPPLRVELRSRGREILYPPRPPSAYVMPAQ